MNQKGTQCKRIIDYIRANGHITSLVAYMRANHRLGKQGICFQQTAIQDRRLQESSCPLFDS